MAYVRQQTLMGMLGTEGPNEVAVLLDDIDHLEGAVASARSALDGTEEFGVMLAPVDAIRSE